MSRLTQWLDRTLYPGVDSRWCDQLFRTEILKHLGPRDHVLDLGAGSGRVAEMNVRGKVQRVCGIDLDERVLDNPYLDEARIASGDQIPYPDDEFDVVISNYVLEHVEDPDAVIREVGRVLKPGGVFLAKTPNRSHYVSVIAAYTPHWFHEMVNEWRGRKSDDTFPTYYRANRLNDLRRLAQRNQFGVPAFVMLEGRPEYLRMTAPTYLLGWLYERLVNSVPGADRFSAALIVEMRSIAKPSPNAASLAKAA